MLVELNLIPLGTGEHISGYLAETVRIVRDSGLPYRLTPSGTCIEGDWKTVMDVVKKCHEHMRTVSDHVITDIRIEDDANATEKLISNIASVEEKMSPPQVSRDASEMVDEGGRNSFPASDPPGRMSESL